MKKLKIYPLVIETIENHALETYPEECCGFLYGTEGDVREISHAGKATNIKSENKRKRFEIDPLEYLQAEKYAMANNLELLGIYHSHPDHPAVPSEHDLKQAAGYFSYIIVSVRKNKINNIRSWQLNDQHEFEEEEILDLIHVKVNS